MSIVKMKRLRLFGMRSDREELLKLLQHMGCVEIDEPVDKLSDPDWEGLAGRMGWHWRPHGRPKLPFNRRLGY